MMLDNQRQDNFKVACDATLSRKDFLAKLVQRAAVAGSLIAAPKIIDKFLIPPAYAVNSTTQVHDSVTGDTGNHHDTVHPPGYITPAGGANPKGLPADNGGWG